jgi:UDP-glucose 4-epimerase
MSLCLVTGGAGFLGSHLVEALLDCGHRVRVLDDLSSGRLANLAEIDDRIEFLSGDVSQLPTVREAIEGVEFVYHFAPPVRSSDAVEWRDTESFDAGILPVLIASRDSTVERVVYASSLRIYGETVGTPLSEDHPVCPISSYARAKLSGEQDCTAFTHIYGLATVRLRYSNIFGRRQAFTYGRTGLIPGIARSLLLGQHPILPGDGRQPLDLLSVNDAIRATLAASQAPRASGRVFNIGRGTTMRLLDVASILGELIDRPVSAKFGGPLLPKELTNLADVTRLRTQLHFQPVGDLKTELAPCVAYYRRSARAGGCQPAACRWS